jgi:hypothetical protein
MEDEEKIIAVCLECNTQDYATKAELEAAGWKIEDAYQVCGFCNFG